jgi:DNA-binding XRE family transcriptional regulator
MSYLKKYFQKDIPNIQEYRDMKIIAIQRMLQLGMLRKDIAKTIGVTYKTLWILEKEEVKNSDLIINFNKYVLENRYPVKIKTKLKWIKL